MDKLNSFEFIFIVGLPGSGKTFYGKRESKRLKAPYLDDPKDLKEISVFINRNSKGIISSPNFCISSYRKNIKILLKKLKVKVYWVFFENDPSQCLINDKKRKSKATSDIHYFSSIYRISPKSHKRPVFK